MSQTPSKPARRLLTMACGTARLIASLDLPAGAPKAALLIVSGGNEIRAGAFAGQASLAADLAAQGFAVLRYDRRGIGDSEGANGGFENAGPDIAAAMATLRQQVGMATRIVALGNCDAASALMLAKGAGADALVLSNPWTIMPEADNAADMPVQALRAHYRARLTNLAAIKRLLTGQIPLRKLVASLLGAAKTTNAGPNDLAQAMAAGLARFDGQTRILLATRDRTAQAFLANWDKADPRIAHCPGASHAFVEPEARGWLLAQVVAVLQG